MPPLLDKKPVNYYEYAKSKGIKLELGVHDNRMWRKKLKGKMYYFGQPLTREGYAAALEEWVLLRSKIAGTRQWADVYQHNIRVFEQVLAYWDAFGLPAAEANLCKQVQKYVDFVKEQFNEPQLKRDIPIGGILFSNREFSKEFNQCFLGTIHCKLPDKWLDRISRMTPAIQEKTPQTIGFWIEAYLQRTSERVGRTITQKTAKNRRHKLSHFKKYADQQAHISTINDGYLTRYHAAIDDLLLERASKEGYFNTFKMFIRWASQDSACDLTMPINLDSKEFAFRELKGTGRKREQKKKLLWSKEDIAKALLLPSPFNCYLLLMLNCGFRHVDISHLRKTDLDFDAGRLNIQRQKLNQLDKAPVINYKLWKSTIDALTECIDDDEQYEYAFKNNVGGQVENSIINFWKRYRDKYGLAEKRLDFIRKTGSTIIKKFDLGLATFYLGEVLSTTESIHYSFIDGEPLAQLDKATDHLGAEFGLAEQPKKTIELTEDVVQGLKKLGIPV